MKISLRLTITLALVLLLAACNRSLAGKGTVGNTNEQDKNAKATLPARPQKGQPDGTAAAQTAAAVMTQAAPAGPSTTEVQVTVPVVPATQPPAATTSTTAAAIFTSPLRVREKRRGCAARSARKPALTLRICVSSA